MKRTRIKEQFMLNLLNITLYIYMDANDKRNTFPEQEIPCR